MSTYVVKRLLQLVPVLLVIILLNFLLLHLAPGNPVQYLIGNAPATPAVVANIRRSLGLDQPLPAQLGLYVWHLLHGDLGFSYVSGQPVSQVIGERLPNTLLLIGTELVLAVVIGLILGITSATHSGTILDGTITVLSVLGYAVPVFWLGQMAILVVSVWLGWLPISGMTTPRLSLTGGDLVLDVLQHLILPAVTLALFDMGVIARLTRASMREALSQDYVLFARAKGLRPRSVVYGHALRNAVLPVITIVGLSLRNLVAGAVLTETVFGWPGIGRLTFDSIYQRNYPVLMGIFLISGLAVMLATLLSDLAYAFADPRIRLEPAANGR